MSLDVVLMQVLLAFQGLKAFILLTYMIHEALDLKLQLGND